MEILVASPDILHAYMKDSGVCHLSGYDSLDRILDRFAYYVKPEDKKDALSVVAFAVVFYKDRILTVEKSDELILGFGRHCVVTPEYRGLTKKNLMLELFYEELDIYIPKAAYSVKPLSIGMLYSKEREYDKGSIGFAFKAKLNTPIPDTEVAGKKIGMRKITDIDDSKLKGWSRSISLIVNERGTF